MKSSFSKKNLIREDINFLEYPTWLINERGNVKEYTIRKEDGFYQISANAGLPSRADKTVLYYLLYKLFNTHDASYEISTTRYEMAKSVFFNTKSIGKSEYERIQKALHKWMEVVIRFEGVFYEGENYTIRLFHVIEEVALDTKTKILTVRFNQQYIRQLKEAKFYKYIDFEEYKKLSRPLSARLYEILVKTFKDRGKWQIDILSLAQKLTIDNDAYPSKIISLLEPALSEINKNTQLNIKLEYDKKTKVCIFKKCSLDKHQEEVIDSVKKLVPERTSLQEQHVLIAKLITHGLSQSKASELLTTYKQEKIEHKLSLLKQSPEAIKNTGAWLLRALKEDWNITTYNKQLEEQKAYEELERKKREAAERIKKLESLNKEFEAYLCTKAETAYKQLPAGVKAVIDQQLEQYIAQEEQKGQRYFIARRRFLFKMFLSAQDQDFNAWAAARGLSDKEIKQARSMQLI